jgi:hypothetical protein
MHITRSHDRVHSTMGKTDQELYASLVYRMDVACMMYHLTCQTISFDVTVREINI